jgi:hypothetical protein
VPHNDERRGVCCFLTTVEYIGTSVMLLLGLQPYIYDFPGGMNSQWPIGRESALVLSSM